VEALGSIQPRTQYEDDPRTAIQQIGTNGIPFLLKWVALDTSPSPIKRIARDLSRNLPPRTVPLKIWEWADSPSPVGPLAAGAVNAFGVLGERAASASPRLARLARNSSGVGPATQAVNSLVRIGPSAVPALVSVVTNRSGRARFAAAISLPQFGTNVLPAIPALVRVLSDPDGEVVAATAMCLTRIYAEPQLVVPALTAALGHQDRVARSAAAYALADFGWSARSAVPALMAARQDGEWSVANAATEALRRIAPETLRTKATR
jgi:hypothetical protein